MSLPLETELSNQMPWVEGTTRVFGVIAHPVDHVRAPMVFNPRFAAAGLPHIMVPINAPPEQLELIINALRAIPNFGGLAVTIPHKMLLADLCDSLGTAAQLTGRSMRFGLMMTEQCMVIILMVPVLSLGRLVMDMMLPIRRLC